MQAVLDGTRDDKEKILDDLLKYCGLDTLAMVEIYEVLKSHNQCSGVTSIDHLVFCMCYIVLKGLA